MTTVLVMKKLMENVCAIKNGLEQTVLFKFNPLLVLISVSREQNGFTSLVQQIKVRLILNWSQQLSLIFTLKKVI
jgi:hypothetical protein